MSARVDCQCGGMVGLFFHRIVVERLSVTEGQEPGALITEQHVPAGTGALRCTFFRNGLAIPRDKLDTFVLNSAATRPEPPRAFQVVRDAIGTRVADNVREMNNPGRAASALDRYAEMPDNP